jgi:hypothetical protein
MLSRQNKLAIVESTLSLHLPQLGEIQGGQFALFKDSFANPPVDFSLSDLLPHEADHAGYARQSWPYVPGQGNEYYERGVMKRWPQTQFHQGAGGGPIRWCGVLIVGSLATICFDLCRLNDLWFPATSPRPLLFQPITRFLIL